MKTDDLPLSKNVEDRRKLNDHRKTLLEQEQEPFKPAPDSALAKQAGIENI